MKKFKKTMNLKFNNDEGFTLLEILISAGLISVLALGISQLIKQTNVVTSTLRTRYDESEFLMLLQEKLSQPSICESNFSVGSPVTINLISQIVDSDGITILAKNGEIYGEADNLKLISLSSLHEKNTSWIKLNLAFEKQNESTGTKTIYRSIIIFAEIDASDNLVRCLGNSLSAVNSSDDLVCNFNNDEEGSRSVMVKTRDPIDNSKTLCIRKNLNTEGCGLLTDQIAYGFTYNSATRNYDFNCALPSPEFLCAGSFLMKFSPEGVPYCDVLNQSQTYQPFNNIAAIDCTGKNYLGLQENSNKLRTYCDITINDTPTPTPTPTGSPTAIPTPSTCDCYPRPVSYSTQIYIRDVPLNDTTGYGLYSLDSCEGGPSPILSTSCQSVASISSEGPFCGLFIKNDGPGNYIISDGFNIYPSTSTNYCSGIIHNGILNDNDNITITLNFSEAGTSCYYLFNFALSGSRAGILWSTTIDHYSVSPLVYKIQANYTDTIIPNYESSNHSCATPD